MNKFIAFIFCLFASFSVFAGQDPQKWQEASLQFAKKVYWADKNEFDGSSTKETDKIIQQKITGFLVMTYFVELCKPEWFHTEFREKMGKFTGNDDFYEQLIANDQMKSDVRNQVQAMLKSDGLPNFDILTQKERSDLMKGIMAFFQRNQHDTSTDSAGGLIRDYPKNYSTVMHIVDKVLDARKRRVDNNS